MVDADICPQELDERRVNQEDNYGISLTVDRILFQLKANVATCLLEELFANIYHVKNDDGDY